LTARAGVADKAEAWRANQRRISVRRSHVTAAPGESARAFFGRRKGKRLRAGHERLLRDLLPSLRVPQSGGPIDLRALFPETASVTIEIGFGGGEHLAAEARAHPADGFIGCEPFANGMAKLLAIVDAEKLSNVRVWDRDATELLPMLPDASVGEVYLLYPDPWPKRRQRKRRFLSDEKLATLARIMRRGAELRFATDIDDYAGWVLARVLRSHDFSWTASRADDWRRPWEGWQATRYEAKAVREGRKPVYLTFRRA
jgi:tRNA (guanine-N7-)-methyltransferase